MKYINSKYTYITMLVLTIALSYMVGDALYQIINTLNIATPHLLDKATYNITELINGLESDLQLITTNIKNLINLYS